MCTMPGSRDGLDGANQEAKPWDRLIRSFLRFWFAR